MLEEAKQDIKNRIISENGEDFYYNLIANRVKELHQFKLSGDSVFGKDDENFRNEVIKSTLIKNIDKEEEKQLYEIVITEIVLDVFLS